MIAVTVAQPVTILALYDWSHGRVTYSLTSSLVREKAEEGGTWSWLIVLSRLKIIDENQQV